MFIIFLLIVEWRKIGCSTCKIMIVGNETNDGVNSICVFFFSLDQCFRLFSCEKKNPWCFVTVRLLKKSKFNSYWIKCTACDPIEFPHELWYSSMCNAVMFGWFVVNEVSPKISSKVRNFRRYCKTNILHAAHRTKNIIRAQFAWLHRTWTTADCKWTKN